jgi:hypothetical protein
MVDSIQSTSLVPLPPTQTGRAVVDPLPAGAPREQQEVAEARDTVDADIRQADFDAYREAKGPTLLPRGAQGPVFDPASAIEEGSVYRGLGQTSPL